MNKIPLAEKVRPTKLSEVIGQTHLIGENQILTRIIEKKEPVNLIFWGPPGTGKTTLSRIVANELNADFIEISAVTSGKKDVEKIVERARQNWAIGVRTVLFVDEIHRFNKAQQDAFLPHVESGLITLIGATTENPSFEVISPLLSRSRVLVLHRLSKDEIATTLKRALKLLGETKRVNKTAIDYLAELAGGDARIGLSNLELALNLADKVTVETVQQAAQKIVPGYDKKGDMHYDVISAFIKSMRGGDVDAALYYLARMLQAGEDPKFVARRMVIFASEDVGLAGNGALGLALNAFMAVERIGMPESGIILSHVVVALSKAKKSRESYDYWMKAQSIAEKTPHLPVPIWLRNAPTKLMKDLGFGKGQKWKAGFHLDKSYLPEGVEPFVKNQS
ncbi:MAG: replication-associated recombination protein A [Candidatus Nomurabacteria bacterium]|jgi:putative ATPase|nr:replication-associated recombination protein A [Candidatus Nomurabacteria bacterium]